MEQNTNSQGAQFRPININYGAIIQNHIRYMRRYKDQQEAQKFARKQREREFQRKLENERGKLLPEIGIGEIQGLYRDQRIRLYNDEQRELSALKQDFKRTGNIESKLKYERRKQFYDNANKLTGAFNDYSKYYAENQADFNTALDGGKKELAEHLAKGRFELTRTGLRIPADDLVLDEFNLTTDDADKDGFVNIPVEVMTEKLMNSGRFSGKANFDATGIDIANGVALDSINGNIKVTEGNTKEAIKQWEAVLLEDPVKLRTIAKLNGNNINEEVDDVQLTEYASQLYEEFTLPKWKTVDNSLNNSLRRQANARANFNTFNKDEEEIETISVVTDEQGTPIQTTAFAGNTFSVALPNKGVQHGSPTSKGRVIYTGANILENGGIELTGFELEKREVTNANGESTEEFVTTSRRVITRDKQTVGEVVKQIPDGKGKKTTFDNAQEFYDTSFKLFNDRIEEPVDKSRFLPVDTVPTRTNETTEQRRERLRKQAGL